jgi:uncharacterized membrane protein
MPSLQGLAAQLRPATDALRVRARNGGGQVQRQPPEQLQAVLRRSPDLLAAAALAIAAYVATALPGGSPARLALAAAIVFVLPGYLLLEAAVPTLGSASRRGLRAVAALGVSPAVVGLAALSTALVQGGFRPANIVLVVTLLCLLLAGAALVRRATAGRAAEPPFPTEPLVAPAEAAPEVVAKP